jgi:hypothetical protein
LYRISVDHPIRGNQSHVLNLRLRDQQAIEQIAMMDGQCENRQGMLVKNSQRA